MDGYDLEMLSGPCNGVTCHKDCYASKLILQGMNKVNFRHLSVPMKYKIAYQERCNARHSMFETKDAWICFGHLNAWKDMLLQ